MRFGWDSEPDAAAIKTACGADGWRSRHCQRSPVDQERPCERVWPQIGRKPTPKTQAEQNINPKRVQYVRYSNSAYVEERPESGTAKPKTDGARETP